MSNEFDYAVTASLQPDAAQAARVGFSVAADTNPDAYAEAKRVARRTGVPADTVFSMPAEIKRQDAIGSIDFDTLAKTSPSTAALLSDVEKAKVSHDDVDTLSKIESTLYSIGKWEVGTAKSLASAVPKFNEGAWGLAQAGADILPDAFGGRVSGFFAEQRQASKATGDAWMPKADGLLESSWHSGVRSLGLNLLQLPLGVGGKMTPLLTSMGLNTGGQAYGEARDKGRSVPESLTFGASQGIVEAGTEMFGMPALLSMLKPGGFGKKAMEYLIKEQGGEQIATHLQDLNEWATLNPEKSFKDYLAARPDAAAQTALATAFGGGGQVAIMKGVDLYVNRGHEAQQASQVGELLTGLNKLAEASHLVQRDAETAQGFFQSVLEDGRDAVYITPEALAQSGLAEKMAQAIPAVQEQLRTAIETGHDIRIPIADLMATMAGPELEQSLIPHVALEPGGFTTTTAQEYLQSDHAKELQAEVERVLGEQQDDQTFKASTQAVKNTIKEQLDTAARFTPQVNDAYSTMVGNFYAAQAARMGTTPEAMFAKYPLRIGAESVAGENVLEQGDPIDDSFRKYLLIDESVKQGYDPVEVAKLAYPEISDAIERVVKSNSWAWAVKQANAYFSRKQVTKVRTEGIRRGTFNPYTLQLTLLNNADLSTFLHESGHFFLEVQADIAAQPDAPEQVKRDMQATLDWFGVNDLAEWSALDFEEKRSYHEQFARGFEAYLFEGKAPSIEMQGVFQRFRAWMLNVYRDLKALNVELTDEVRGVFDRMLATNEQIALAEQGRSMMPLFTSPEQIGMTPAEFADYQALGTDATNEAIEDLQARGLRDMQWIHNARGRVIKQLQKESAEKRSEVQMAVRSEVMAQPIYRAWEALTSKKQPSAQSEELSSWENHRDATETEARRKAKNSAWENSAEGKKKYEAEGDMAKAQQKVLKREIESIEQEVDKSLAEWEMKNPRPAIDEIDAEKVRLDLGALSEMELPAEVVNALKARKMTAKDGFHPDIVADMFGFSSGDELVRRLASVESPKEEIDAITDQRMLEQFGDLSSEDAIKKAADKAIHNDARARVIATELSALEKATGKKKTLASAAKEYAAAMIARLRVRDIKPGQYASAEVRAAKAAEKAGTADIAKAAAEKRNQLINAYATRAAYDAQDEIEKGLRYLKTFDSAGKRKGLDADYTDQIDALLERFDLRKIVSGKAIDKRKALAEWLTSQQDAGIDPDIPPELVNEAFRKSYKEMTVEELRGLIDTVKQIEHLGRLKHRLLTARDQRAYEAIRDEIAASIEHHADGRKAQTRTPDTVLSKSLQKMRNFWASHIKAAMWSRIMDGGKDGGPMWEYFMRAANERGDQETTMRAEATAKLSEIMAPLFDSGKMTTKTFFPSINRSLTREARLAIALNVGNAGNLQRLQGGEGWTDSQIAPVLRTLTAQEWVAVQAIWDHFESYRPQIAAKERRVYGKEPDWVVPIPFTVQTADGQTVQMRGGYYPVKYDPAASQRAEEHADAEGAKRQLQGAYTTATTRRSFTKSRVEEVNGRPLLYSLAGVYSGVNDVIHDLAWHEWLIDTNRLLRSQTIDGAIRNHYGPEVKQQFKKWAADIAEGDKPSSDAGDIAVNYLRQSVSVAGLGFNVVSAAMQPLGITQSIVRVGAKWIGRGVSKYLAHPIELTRQVNEMSSFMENRARTRFRELNELRNRVEGQTAAKEFVGHYAYFLMMRFQQAVDVPTWWGAYEKAVAEGNDDDRAVSLADQAVIDAQGGGQTKDQAGIERTDAKGKLFTVFYSFMNTAMNLGVAQTMTEKSKAKLVSDYALLYLIPPMLGYALKAAITPGDSGDDDWGKLSKKLLAAQIDYMMGMMVYVREFSDVAKTLTGANDMGRDYQGPAGLRLVVDGGKFAKQVSQGEFDDAFRKSSVNLIGDLFGLPSAQINRTITGTKALSEGKTSNPTAVVFGFQEKR